MSAAAHRSHQPHQPVEIAQTPSVAY